MTEVNSYGAGTFLDTGWVAGYLLIGLGALWVVTSSPVRAEPADVSATSLVAPYAPVLVVLAVTGIQLFRGRHIDRVAWVMAFALVVLVLGREVLRLWDQGIAVWLPVRNSENTDRPTPSLDPEVDAAFRGR